MEQVMCVVCGELILRRVLVVMVEGKDGNGTLTHTHVSEWIFYDFVLWFIRHVDAEA